jgi:3-oxoacyl-[acyl-carrier protein] reductase
MPRGFENVAIVTGSGTGIGAATAEALAAKSINVVINHLGDADRADAESTAETCRAKGADVLVCQADVSRENDRCRLIAAPVKRWGRLDYLVNNAGASAGRDLNDLDGATAAEFHSVYDVNIIAPFMLAREAARHMRALGSGAIVNVSSIAGLAGIGSSYPYLVTKAGLINLTLALARVLAPEIRVNVVCPGLVNTAWPEREMGHERFERVREQIVAKGALKSVTEPADVAETIVWLLTGAPKITGEVIRIDAGVHLGPGM